MDTILQRFAEIEAGPKYKALASAVRGAIADQALEPGDKMPTVRDLAWAAGVTPGTVARAYTVLTDEGALEAEVGRGTFVAPPKTPVRDDIWARQTDLADPDTLSLISPRLADVGQVAAIRAALARVGEDDPLRLLSYPTRSAYRPVREAVAHWLRDVPLGGLDADDIVLAHGGQNALMVVLQAILTGPKPVILVEDLSYAGFRRAAELLRAEVVSVPMDEQGIIPEALEAAARRSGAQVLCTSPEVHNPTGIWTPQDRRQRIVEVAERAGLKIIEDDCYRLGQSNAPTYRALSPQAAWHISSISKMLTPALRVGFAVAPRGQGDTLRRSAEYGFFGLAQPLAEVTQALLTDPRTEVLAQDLKMEMGKYIRVAVNTLGAFELTWNVEVPFLWLRLPPGWRAAAFCQAAEMAGVRLRSADEFALRDGRAPHAVRIAVNAQVPIARFEAGMQVLRRLLASPPEQISV